MKKTFDALLRDVRHCRRCEAVLPLGPRPVLQIHPQAKILIAGQAPGLKVHESGIPFDDASGKRLREWMGVSHQTFYDPKQIAILPMGFCYPGRGKSGDLPPRPECAPAWRAQLLRWIEKVELTLVIGKYAQTYHLGESKRRLTDRVKAWPEEGGRTVPLPHPSPRNNIWLRRNPWFEEDRLPELRIRVREALGCSH